MLNDAVKTERWIGLGEPLEIARHQAKALVKGTRPCDYRFDHSVPWSKPCFIEDNQSKISPKNISNPKMIIMLKMDRYCLKNWSVLIKGERTRWQQKAEIRGMTCTITDLNFRAAVRENHFTFPHGHQIAWPVFLSRFKWITSRK